MQTSPRNGASIDRIYIHTNEGPDSVNGAAGLVNYLGRIDGGYHVVVDNENTVRAAGDDLVVWGEGGDNEHALAICIIGYAAQTAEQWADAYSVAAIERCARQVAAWCEQYKIPAYHVRPGSPGSAPSERGIAEHADDRDPSSEGHTDPGPNFPIGAFIGRVGQLLAPPVIDWAAVKRLAQWEKSVTENPLVAGETSPAVLVLKKLLKAKGYTAVDLHNSKLGSLAVQALNDFKEKNGLTPDGICGPATAKALLK